MKFNVGRVMNDARSGKMLRKELPALDPGQATGRVLHDKGSDEDRTALDCIGDLFERFCSPHLSLQFSSFAGRA
jgi:hypothetical protein